MTGDWWIPALIMASAVGVIFLIAWLIKSRTKVPFTVRIQRVEPEDEDKEAIPIQGEYESELSALGFERVGDFTVNGIDPGNIHRVYMNPSEKCLAIVTPTSVGGRRRPHLEFYAHFQDNGTLSTDQALTPNFLAMPPERELRRLPANLEPETIWKIHKATIEQMKTDGRILAAVEKDSIYKHIERDQQELIDYQIKSGLLVRDEDETQLRPTWKFAFYFLFKILDPIPFGISLPRFLAGFLIPAAILLGFFWLARGSDLEKIFLSVPLAEIQMRYAAATLGAVISGLILGVVFQARGLLWAGVIAIIEFFLIKNAFPNAMVIILTCAYSGLVGNRISEYRLSKAFARLTGPLIVLAGLIIIGWYLLDKNSLP
jgi:hypothetical protein